MKEDCANFQAKGLMTNKFFLPLLKIHARTTVHTTEYLCTRTDSDVQGVESGSSILMIMNTCLSEFTLHSGVDSSFIFSLLSGFARTLLSENVNGSPHHSITYLQKNNHENDNANNIRRCCLPFGNNAFTIK